MQSKLSELKEVGREFGLALEEMMLTSGRDGNVRERLRIFCNLERATTACRERLMDLAASSEGGA